ncbi:hypothetical protein G7Y89_g4998 [Cudoniella acicularis]|uniref:Uncharacterized protein n=1 Tax=Cudoniella acicularis TaxID=354080 RepID=A0A8H4W3S2_9HELO|nr:hypothetical protein G7Y89_g4998 [Cudoniella acicularis]
MSPRSATSPENRTFWNPTILALPYWSKNQYLIVSMVTPTGEASRRNIICEANIYLPKGSTLGQAQDKTCSDDDLALLGPNGGLRRVTTPNDVKVPATPAAKCEDARSVYPALKEVVGSLPKRLGPGPLMLYPTLTELTRNPPSTRQSYEKNWVVFSPSSTSSYLQYDLNSSTRTFAKLVGGGLTTPNMTDQSEKSCLHDPTLEEVKSRHYNLNSTWHQATPALKLILCSRSSASCIADIGNTVFFAAIQRKIKHPILFANETTFGWTAEETWDDVPEAKEEKWGFWGRFTYTTTLAYAWGREEGDMRDKGTGYLDDEVGSKIYLQHTSKLQHVSEEEWENMAICSCVVNDHGEVSTYAAAEVVYPFY